MTPTTAHLHRPTPSFVRLLLQFENAAITALALWIFARSGHSWTLFAVTFLLPDLAMLGYLAGPRIGATCYNTAHSYAAPVALAALSLAGIGWAWPAALIWGAHIALDRTIGYGLKYATDFKDTHLTRL